MVRPWTASASSAGEERCCQTAGQETSTPPGHESASGRSRSCRRRAAWPARSAPTPVCVFLCDGEAYAVDDRCPHMGFPLHRGTVENGLLTCHWHHARFDLASGGTLDPFADDVRAHDVEVDGGDVVVVLRPDADPAAPATCAGSKRASSRA